MMGRKPSRARGIKLPRNQVDFLDVDAVERQKLLARYEVPSQAFERIAQRRPSPVVQLVTRRLNDLRTPSARELQVLALIAEGMTDSEIGGRLFVASNTVKSHVKNLRAKLGARSRAHAVAVGFRRGLIA
jgi:DNA-binding CsgD family transcriptional regulator